MNEQTCNNCLGGWDGKIRCITCNGTGWVEAVPHQLMCEYSGCTRKGSDRIISGREPVSLCGVHYIFFKMRNNYPPSPLYAFKQLKTQQ